MQQMNKKLAADKMMQEARMETITGKFQFHMYAHFGF